MGDPKRTRKKYSSPMHPWQKDRMEVEQKLLKEYGMKNKRELWKMNSVLRNFHTRAKELAAATGEQANKEKEQLFIKLQRYGLIGETPTLDDALGITLRDILERRLQTQVFRKQLARSMQQARQFIIHQHIVVGEKKMTVPSYLVSTAEESKIFFTEASTLSNPEHPERQVVQKLSPKKEAQEEKGAKEGKEAPQPKGRSEEASAPAQEEKAEKEVEA